MSTQLPGQPTAPPTADATTGKEPRQAGRFTYVLVVDDEPAAREFLTRCLAGWGFAVKQGESAADALEIMAAEPASLVLCDIKMPTHDGLWLAERLAAQWPQTPVIMTTALDDLETIRHSRQLGVVDYVTKPIRHDQLLRAVRSATSMEKGPMADDMPLPTEERHTDDKKVEAEYALECVVRCPACGERIASVKAVRLIRSHVNFTSTLPRRGRVIACPHCLAVIPAELTNF